MDCAAQIIEDIINAVEALRLCKPGNEVCEQEKDMYSGKMMAFEDCLEKAKRRFRANYHQDYMKIRPKFNNAMNFKK